MAERRSNEQRTAATRAALVRSARELFEGRGYAATSTADIVRTAKVTRGALYHHFTDKRDLLRAVVVQIQEELLERVVERAFAKTDPWDMFVAGWVAFHEVTHHPAVRLLMIEAPPVLGFDDWREIDDIYCLQPAIAGLRELMDLGIVAEEPVEPLARVLLSGSNALGVQIASAADPEAERQRLLPIWIRQLEHIRRPQPAEAP